MRYSIFFDKPSNALNGFTGSRLMYFFSFFGFLGSRLPDIFFFPTDWFLAMGVCK